MSSFGPKMRTRRILTVLSIGACLAAGYSILKSVVWSREASVKANLLLDRKHHDERSTQWTGSAGECHDFERGAVETLADAYIPVQNTGVTMVDSRFVNGVAGYSLFENLYLRNGTFYFVTDTPDAHTARPPPLKFILSAPADEDGKRNGPSDDDFQIITTEQAEQALGRVAVRLQGTSVLLNDQKHAKSSSFMGHYFHFVVETFLGAWRLLAVDFADSHGEGTTAGMQTPRRIMFRTEPDDWRDRAGLTPWFLNNVMPSSSVEDKFVWQDRAKSDTTFVFDKITISDRFAAHRFGGLNARWNKMSAELVNLPAPIDWLAPLRNNILTIGSVYGCKLTRQISGVPVVTYINRQKTARRLNDTDAIGVVQKLQELHDEGIIEFYDAQMELLPRVEQFCLAARTDILVGVHGNGLSHQLWMRPGSSVVEIMDVGGFAMDYALPAELVGHTYYALHNNTVFSNDLWVTPDGKGTKQSKNFHGKNIRLDPGFLQSLVRDIGEEGDWL